MTEESKFQGEKVRPHIPTILKNILGIGKAPKIEPSLDSTDYLEKAREEVGEEPLLSRWKKTVDAKNISDPLPEEPTTPKHAGQRVINKIDQ